MARFDGGISPDNLASIPRRPIRDIYDLYPDRQATPNADGTYPLRDTGYTQRLDKNIVPTTTEDMSEAFKWQLGDSEIEGDHAKANKALQAYRNDMQRGSEKEHSYKHIFVDTFNEVGPQLKKLKKKKRH